jgi:transcription-repair coupling factor (superfamily II helicase)
LPKTYVEADDARLEAYRRLAGVKDVSELNDLRAEWQDRYGKPPKEVEGLLSLTALKVLCLEHGISNVVVLPAKVGVRSKPFVKISPLSLAVSQQMRIRRSFGSSAYDEGTREFKCERGVGDVTPEALIALVTELTTSSN